MCISVGEVEAGTGQRRENPCGRGPREGMTSPRARSLPRTSDRDRGAGIHILHAKWRKATHSEPGVAARWPHGTPCPLSRPHHCCWGCGTKGGVVGEGADRGEGGPCSQTPWGEAADPCFLRYTAQTQNRKRPWLLPAGKARPLPPPAPRPYLSPAIPGPRGAAQVTDFPHSASQHSWTHWGLPPAASFSSPRWSVMAARTVTVLFFGH